jgi:hypothetical protein
MSAPDDKSPDPGSMQAEVAEPPAEPTDLDAMRIIMERGDFREAGRFAGNSAELGPDRHRTRPDPFAVIVLVSCSLLVIAIAFLTLFH